MLRHEVPRVYFFFPLRPKKLITHMYTHTHIYKYTKKSHTHIQAPLFDSQEWTEVEGGGGRGGIFAHFVPAIM